MKYGILTFHRGINAGGFLQACSLSSFISSLDHEVQVIDYMNETQRRVEHDGIFRTRHPVKRWQNIRKLRRFEKAFDTLPLGPPVRDPGEIAECGYDAIIFGSDEIWNLCSSCSGADLTFFGEGISNVRKISYAPSFGSTPIDHEGLVALNPLLEDFDKITVRDKHSAGIVQRITGTPPQLVVDPVLLSARDEILETRKTKGAIGLYLMAPRPEDIARIRAFAKAGGKKTCSVGYYHPWADRNIASLGPEEIPGLLAGCSLVVTNTFHGVVFSLKNRIPFIIIDHPAKSRKIDTLRDGLGLRTVNDQDARIGEDHLNPKNAGGKLIEDWITGSKEVLTSTLGHSGAGSDGPTSSGQEPC